MPRTLGYASLLTLLLLTSQPLLSAEKPHWGYEGDESPEHWGDLDPGYGTCKTGRNQSPINLTGMVKADLPKLDIDYDSAATEIVNNGHTIQVNIAPGSRISINGHQYALKQFHFHSPSENAIDSNAFPMEAHFVHADKDGNLAVIAVMFNESKMNTELEKAWSQMPERAGQKTPLHTSIDVSKLLPEKTAYYRFNGSLTTPPCSEGVVWIVMKQTQNASHEQIAHFTHTMHHSNNRPVQPLNARLILE